MKNLTLPLLCIAVFFTACSPTDYVVERDISINAPANIVFDQVNNHKNRDTWSPWEAMDPNMTKNYEGPESGVGSLYSWTGNDSVGTGTLKIVESAPNKFIKSELTFSDPFEAHSFVDWSFSETPDGTIAIWKISGQLPGYLFWMGQSDMEEQMAPDLEKGLANLKRVSEEKASMESDEDLTAKVVTVESIPYYYIQNEIKISELSSDFFGSSYGQLMQYLGADSQNMLGAPFALYPKWDMENDLGEIAVSIPCKSDKPGNETIKKGMTYAGEVMQCVFVGPYEETGKAHQFLQTAIPEQGYMIVGAPWETYANDPQTVSGPEEYITEVNYPVEKKE